VILRCPACRHHWYREQPDKDRLAAMYAAALPLMAGGEHSPGREAHSAYLRNQLARLYRLACLSKRRQPCFLEYGAGAGRWADAAAELGFEVCAYEPHPIRISGPRKTYEVVTRTEDLGTRHFDVINVEQVLEHVPDPHALVRSLHQYCESGTVLRFTVPDLTRAAARPSLWNDWPFNGKTMHLMAPFEHLHGFTAGSLRTLVARAGFVPATGPAVWSAFPKYSARRGLSRLFPFLGQTMALVRPADRVN
jgi:SAM-dependent methyltransferase